MQIYPITDLEGTTAENPYFSEQEIEVKSSFDIV